MPPPKFSYQNLRVYEDLIKTITVAEETVSKWDSMHAIVDHFSRASEGAVLCLAEACRTHTTGSKLEAAGQCLGSLLECSACFDIARCKTLVSQEACEEVKSRLSSVYGLMYALAKSWQKTEVREQGTGYGEQRCFNHEKLEVYGLGLQINRHIASWQFLQRLPRPEFRRIDEAATSIVLNIAEGNGRPNPLDHGRFLEIANASTTKLAARLEICAVRGAIEQGMAEEIIGLLVKIDRMTAKLADVWRNRA